MENSKNIFVIPTTDPSQVYLVKSTNALRFTSSNPEIMKHYGSGTHNQHVYITNKDLYDRGDWCIDIEAEEIFKVAEVKEYSGIVRSDTADTYVYDACAKIVLTSDPKLIADGIAEIDIEFLKLLKDTKLEEIGTVKVKKTPLLSNNGRALYGYKYTPIIPKKNIVVLAGEDAVKEEPKQGTMSEAIKQVITNQLKQETLEEFINEELDDVFFTNISKRKEAERLIEMGAKWQQQNNTSKVNRVEVIQHSEPFNGRAYTNYNAKYVEIQFQDNGKTLKIFLK